MLRLIDKQESAPLPPVKEYGPEALTHHWHLVEGYLQSHVTRNHSPKTIAEIRRHLTGWFEAHGGAFRPLYAWEAMAPMLGRNRIVEYGRALVEVELENSTIRRYLGHLRDFFSYVLEHPVVFEGATPRRLSELYGPIEQPVSEFDCPQHSYDGAQRGIPIDSEKLYDLYTCLRDNYLGVASTKEIGARDYSIAVLAGESGLRIDEIIHLEISKDLFFASKRLQTRHAKAMKGSGKRSRPTLFPPLARDTIEYYLKNHRPHFVGAEKTDFLFITRSGDKMTHSSMNGVLNNLVSCAQKNGFPIMDHFSWHWFRRVFATRFIERFPDKLHTLIGLLGHVTRHTVHSYIHHSDAWTDRKLQETLESINTHGYSLDF